MDSQRPESNKPERSRRNDLWKRYMNSHMEMCTLHISQKAEKRLEMCTKGEDLFHILMLIRELH